MAKKGQEVEDNETKENEATSALGGMDFNVDDEYTPDPLIPEGTYHGALTNVKFNVESFNISWEVSLHDNGGVMSDNETAIDGARVVSISWLPKPGDESLMTPAGKLTKRQWKINALADQLNELDIKVVTAAEIAEAIQNAEWIGIEVSVTLNVEEYKGKFSNKVALGGMKKSTMF